MYPTTKVQVLGRIPPLWDDVWKELTGKCGAGFSGIDGAAAESLKQQLDCHIVGSNAPGIGPTWDFEAWHENASLTTLVKNSCNMPTSATAAAAYDGWIVQWSDDSAAQKSSWLVVNRGGKLIRNWISSAAVYGCLKAKGTPGPIRLHHSYLDGVIPDEAGFSATCAAPTSAPDSKDGRRVSVAQGPVGPKGYRYAISLSGFAANTAVPIVCRDSADPGGFSTFSLPTDAAGNGSTSNQCFSADGPEHWVTADGLESNRVTWSTTAPQPTVPPTPQPTPQPPTSTAITVDNRVTNGAGMREDTPAYLSSATRNFCKRNGCALGGTDMGSGAVIAAECTVLGDRTTNGQDNSSVDDGNPGLFTSTRWYGIRWGDGRFGYLSEVWVVAANRGGLGLRAC
ncbi:MAG: hypothetical protein Q7T55_01985 [Solirubrobacteraceae bacterium]|nr:hypothetical protein [Solirubrobacteraceae bacterium]